MDVVGEAQPKKIEEIPPIESIEVLSDLEILLMHGTVEERAIYEQYERNRPEIVAKLEAYYGDRVFYYGKYQGTISQIIQKCPAIDAVVNEGFDAAVEWVDAYAEEAPEQLLEDDAAPETEQHVDNTQEDRVEEVEGSTSIEKATAVPSVLAAKEQPQAALNEVSDSAKSKSSKDVPNVRLSNPSLPKAKETDIAVKEEVPHAAPRLIEKVEKPEVPVVILPALREGDEVKQETDVPVVEAVDIPREADPIYSEVVEELAERTVSFSESTDTGDSIDSAEVSVDEPLVDHVELKLAPETVLDDKPEDVKEAFVEETLLEKHTKLATTEIIEHFEAWNEIAKEAPPLELLVERIVQDLEVPLTDEPDASLLSQEVEAVALLDNNQTITESSIELELEEMNEATTELLFLEEARPEYRAVYVQVKAAEKAAERLFQATTKEACAFELVVIRNSLVSILHSLGYEAPEKIVAEYLRQHSPVALRQLVKQLEFALRKAIYREIRLRHLAHSKARQTRFGKFIQFIMHSVSRPHSYVPFVSD